MNDQPSPIGRVDDDTPPSPKRKKVRAKYAPKACVSCRRSKLKCSGENPCQRCLDNGKRCFYSEDQTAAEALQNLSRPNPVQPPLTSLSTNGNGIARRSILPRHEAIERRASDASVLGLSMEARMARIEGMMETLIQERGASFTPRGSMEREEAVSDSFQMDPTFQAPIQALDPNLAPTRQQVPFPQESPERVRHSISAVSPASSVDSAPTIRIGTRNLVFPSPTDYQKYIDFFFADINPRHPCVNEAEFRSRSERMLVSRVIHASEATFLALNYIIFACSDILVDTTPLGVSSKPPGWQWFQIADELVGKRSLSGRGDLSLLQFLIWEACYLSWADKPNAAYNVIGLACRLVFQFNLHQQSSWRSFTPFQIHMRQRIFWTVYLLDRCVSLSCGRPYGIRDLDVDVEQPEYLNDRDIHPDQPLPESDPFHSSSTFLCCMIYWGHLVADAWDRIFAASAPKQFHHTNTDSENTAILDARIKHFSENVLPSIPLLASDHSEVRQLRQHVIAYTRTNALRLLLRKNSMLSLKYDGPTGRLCGDLVLDTIGRIRAYSSEAKHPSSFRHYIVSSLAISMLFLSTLLVRDLSFIGLQDRFQGYADAFLDILALLNEMAITLRVAKRVLEDFKDVVTVIRNVLDARETGQPWEARQSLVPAYMNELFPYRTLDFAQQSGVGMTMQDLQATAGAQWNGHTVDPSMVGQSVEGWDLELAGRASGYGVLWI